MRGFVVLVTVLLSFATPAFAADLLEIPDKSEAEQFKDAPEQWRDYLIKARAAERIADPLQRCLAFPDPPNNEWPTGHAEAHCRHHFAVERLTLDQIASLVERGEVAKLEEILDQSLARHFSEDGHSEAIHDTFNYLLTSREDNDRIGQVTESWLKQAPKSAYANLARGSYYNGAAWKARGSKYASETPRESMRRMSELVEQAIPYFRKAISINPKLMPAYTGMVDLGMVDSRPDLEAKAVAQAEKIDPACVELANVRMRTLKPRWGGSYEEMLAYANQLSAYLPGRPHLAIHVAAPFADRGDRLIADDQYTEEAMQVLDIAVAIGSDEDALHDAASVAGALTDGKPDGWKRLAYLLQESRFREINAWGARDIAWRLVRNEPEWSLRYALRALALEPDSAYGHYLAGAGYYNTRRHEDADREYRIAIEDGEQRQASLREVAEMWLWNGDLQKPEARKANASRAKPYIDRLIREYPDDGRGAIMAFWAGVFENPRVDEPVLRAALKKVDRSDPWQKFRAEHMDQMLRQIDDYKKQHPQSR